jgi:hypothetical protein
MLLALSMLSFSLITLDAAQSYADLAYRRELRIQAALNASACIDTATLMLAKDFFLNGTTTVPEFSCTAYVNNPHASGAVGVNVVAKLEGVSAYANAVIQLPNI